MCRQKPGIQSGETGLVESPEFWRWSSYRAYSLGEAGPVKINEWEVRNMKMRSRRRKKPFGVGGWESYG
jgi:hypothetical protein